MSYLFDKFTENQLTLFLNNRRKNYNQLSDINKNLFFSEKIHIIIFNNIYQKNQENRLELKKLINQIINNPENKKDHIIIYAYGELINEIIPIIPCNPQLIKLIENIIHIDFDNSIIFNSEQTQKIILDYEQFKIYKIKKIYII